MSELIVRRIRSTLLALPFLLGITQAAQAWVPPAAVRASVTTAPALTKGEATVRELNDDHPQSGHAGGRDSDADGGGGESNRHRKAHDRLRDHGHERGGDTAGKDRHGGNDAAHPDHRGGDPGDQGSKEQNGGWVQAQGTATPELPSGALAGLALAVFGAGALAAQRRLHRRHRARRGRLPRSPVA